jgi:curved DNA-binding protein CbpA
MTVAKASEILGISDHPEEDLTEDILKQAFRTTARREHPDKSKHPDATARFQEVQHAFEFLTKKVTGEDDSDDELDAEHLRRHREMFQAFMEQMIFEALFGGQIPGRGGRGGARSPFFRASPFFHYDSDDDDSYYDDDDSEDDDYYYARGRSRRGPTPEEIARQKEEWREMAEREGRPCFETMSQEELVEHAKRRACCRNIKGLQRDMLVELLVEHERAAAETRRIQNVAPLYQHWCQVVGIGSAAGASAAVDNKTAKLMVWNGRQVKAVEYDETGKFNYCFRCFL